MNNVYTANTIIEVEANKVMVPVLVAGQPLTVNIDGKFELWNGIGNMIGVVLSSPVANYVKIKLISDYVHSEEESEEDRIIRKGW